MIYRNRTSLVTETFPILANLLCPKVETPRGASPLKPYLTRHQNVPNPRNLLCPKVETPRGASKTETAHHPSQERIPM